MKKFLVCLLIMVFATAAFAATASKRPGSYANGFHYTETVASGQIGSSVIIPPMTDKRITVSIICGAGSGKVQTTTSSDASIAGGTATWLDWASGAVSGTVADALLGPVTGIRAVSISGPVAIEIVY